MKKDFTVNINKFTKGLTQQGFGTPMVYTEEIDIPYKLITDLKELDDLKVPVESEAYQIAQIMMSQKPKPKEIAVYGVKAGEEGSTTKNLNEILEKQSEWFYIVTDKRDTETVKEIAKWAEANDKLYFTTIDDMELLEELEYENTNVYMHDQEGVYLGEAMAAYYATQDAGSATGKFKTLVGIPEAGYDNTEVTAIHKAGGNTYKRKYGNLETTEGFATNGEYTDIVLAGYYIKFRIEENAHLTARSTKKLGYVNQGIGSLVKVVREVTFDSFQKGLVAPHPENEDKPHYELSYRTRQEVNALDRKARVYNDIEATIYLAGAIHEGDITINLVS